MANRNHEASGSNRRYEIAGKPFQMVLVTRNKMHRSIRSLVDEVALSARKVHDRLILPATTFPNAVVDEARVAAWMITLEKARDVLEGRLLIPHWRFKQGFDLKAYFETATETDLVMILTGFGAVPFLKDGPIASPEDFRAVQDAFGSDWLGYAFWFN